MYSTSHYSNTVKFYRKSVWIFKGYKQADPRVLQLALTTDNRGPCLYLSWNEKASGFGFSPGPLINPLNLRKKIKSYITSKDNYIAKDNKQEVKLPTGWEVKETHIKETDTRGDRLTS